MARSFQLVITCRHNDPRKIITTPEGEHVCRCGVILEEKLPDMSSAAPQSTLSLYNQVENGCAPGDMKVINKKIHIYSSTASEFSNICSKLDLSDAVQQRAWGIHTALRNRASSTKAKCMAFSIYVACRESSQAVGEQQIREAIQSALCVKNVPGMLSVISELHDEALRVGIDTNKGHSPNYYLNMAMSRRQGMFDDPHEYDRFTIRVMENFARLNGNHQNRARRAVNIALSEMGMA